MFAIVFYRIAAQRRNIYKRKLEIRNLSSLFISHISHIYINITPPYQERNQRTTLTSTFVRKNPIYKLIAQLAPPAFPAHTRSSFILWHPRSIKDRVAQKYKGHPPPPLLHERESERERESASAATRKSSGRGEPQRARQVSIDRRARSTHTPTHRRTGGWVGSGCAPYIARRPTDFSRQAQRGGGGEEIVIVPNCCAPPGCGRCSLFSYVSMKRLCSLSFCLSRAVLCCL